MEYLTQVEVGGMEKFDHWYTMAKTGGKSKAKYEIRLWLRKPGEPLGLSDFSRSSSLFPQTDYRIRHPRVTCKS
jgi:hypothetical protein